MAKLKKKYRKKAKILLLLIVIIIIALVIWINFPTQNKKLKKIGYTSSEIIQINKLDEKHINYILEHKYMNFLGNILSEKYFINSKLLDYISYHEEYPSKSIKDVISIINVKANYKWYENPTVADTSKGFLTLVNKFNYLDETYILDDIIDIPLSYAYSGKKISSSIYEPFIEMLNSAKEDGYTLLVTSGYRSYTEQEKTYTDYKKKYGTTYADDYAARAGYSEHELGYALDIFSYGATTDNFDETEEFKWLQNNAHKYGFILRYPKDKEYLTGYKYEPWHYRYVGIEVATAIYEENITFDEYYAYYINKN